MTRKRLFFDIEVSPNVVLSWRTGYNLTITPFDIIQERAIICICWKWEGQETLYSLTWDKKQNDKAMLKAFLKEVNKADELIGHNSDRFDVKWLRTRCVYHGVDMFPTYQTLDTLKMAKSGFIFNSNKLDYIAQYLGVGKKLETGGLDLWKKVCLEKDETALEHMVEYCKQDVVILEKVFEKLRPYSKHKLNYATLRGGDKFECPHCGTYNVKLSKTYTTSTGVMRHSMVCKEGCRSAYTVSNKTYQDWLKHLILVKNIK